MADEDLIEVRSKLDAETNRVLDAVAVATGMPRRRGRVCAVCGYPAPESTAPLCDQCHDWQRVAAYADAAIQFSKSPALAPRRTEGG